jgi:hypothetical protein
MAWRVHIHLRVRLLGSASLALATFLAVSSQAAERELEQAPPPSSAREIESPLQRAFLRPYRKEPLIPWVRDALEKLPPFFSDTQLDARFRTYYLRKDRTTGVLSEAWAMGGSVYYRSGWLKQLLSLEAEFFTSQPIIAPADRNGTLLLAPGQQGYNVLGLANAKLRYKGIELTGYRQYLDLPYVNRSDSRMTPQTFEAVTLTKDEGTLLFSTGYVWTIKRRNADEFVSMAEAVGVPKERGLAYAGVLYQPSEDFHAGASAGVVPDVLVGFYSETAYSHDLSQDLELRFDGQFTYQGSVGNDLLIGGPFQTWNVGLRASASWLGALLRLGFSVTGDERFVFSPYGSNPSYVDLMQRSFTQADEKALLASASYDFTPIGAAGLSLIVTFVQGWDARLLDLRGDAREVDVTLDYRVPERGGFLEGLWLRVRASWLDEERSEKDGTDFRVILRYDFPVL